MFYQDDDNGMIGVCPQAEGESWFTQGNFVVPQVRSIEALPKQPWDSYKPDFWWGIISWQQAPLFNKPYFWQAPGGWGGNDVWLDNAHSNHPGPLISPVTGNAYRVQNFTTPLGGIYTGTDDPCAV